MKYVRLGRTGLEVSVLGLGAGGPSRLGQTTGRSESESEAVVRRAHLEANARSILAPPLPPAVRARLERTFAAVDDVSGQ